MLLAAAAFNLRKYMKFKPTKSISMVMALEEEQQQAFSGSSFTFATFIFNRDEESQSGKIFLGA
jgi:hypothetical protein